jgi:DNA-binding PadR family transcriptional regulator
MSVSRALLGLLERESSHGYTLKQQYDRHFSRVKPVPFGQVYASLARFERDGLARVVSVESGEGPERKLYAITPSGVSVVEEWMYTPDEPTAFAASSLFTKTTLALMSGRSAERVLDAQRAVHMARMRELTTQRRSAAVPELLAITYELNHLDADLRWIEEAGNRLDALREGLEEDARDR